MHPVSLISCLRDWAVIDAECMQGMITTTHDGAWIAHAANALCEVIRCPNLLQRRLVAHIQVTACSTQTENRIAWWAVSSDHLLTGDRGRLGDPTLEKVYCCHSAVVSVEAVQIERLLVQNVIVLSLKLLPHLQQQVC